MTEELTPIRKAAIAILSMDKPAAAEVMKSLSATVQEQITTEIWLLGSVTEEQRIMAIQELSGKIQNRQLSGGIKVAKNLLQDAIGEEKAVEMIDHAREDYEKKQSFRELLKIKPLDLAGFLSKEQPSTIALILGFLPSTKIAEVIRFFDEELRNQVIVKLSNTTPVNKELVDRIEKVFVKKILEQAGGQETAEDKKIGGAQQVAEILQNLDREMGDQLLGVIQESSEEIGTKVAQELFTFADIAKLDDSALQRLMRDVPMEKLPLALKNVSSEVFDKFCGNLSKRAKENLIEEMEFMGKVKLSEVKNAQQEVVGIVRALEAAGEIELGGGGEDDVYV